MSFFGGMDSGRCDQILGCHFAHPGLPSLAAAGLQSACQSGLAASLERSYDHHIDMQVRKLPWKTTPFFNFNLADSVETW